MRTKIQDRRLKKLIAFLRELPRRKFDFTQEVSETKTNGHTCATVACAIGWTPVVFPRCVKWKFSDDKYRWFMGFELRGETASYFGVAEDLFGVPHEHNIFFPGEQLQAGVRECGDYATPKQVARMLEEYRKKYPAK